MIRICTIQTETLPPSEQLLGAISFDVGEDRRRALSRSKTARESLAGLYLLQKMAADAGVELFGKSLAYEAGGRPYFPGLPLDFSITHTASLVACALSLPSSPDAPPVRIGLDAEALGARSIESMERIASRFFTDAEREVFLASPDESTFLKIWTGKEALCKQDGIGLSGIAQFDTLAPENRPRLTLYHTPSAILTLAASEACEILFER